MNKKIIRNIILSVLCLALLGGAYFGVTSLPDEGETSTENGDAFQSIPVFKTDYKTITTLKIQNEKGAYSIQKNGDSDYLIPEFSYLTFSGTKLASAVMDFASISATKELTEEQPFEQTAEVTVSYNENEQATFLLGNKVIGDNGYFLKHNGKLYVISEYKADSFLKDINAYRDTALATIDTQSLKSFSIWENGQEKVSIHAMTEEEAENFHKMTSFVMTHPYHASVNGDGLTPIMENFPANIAVSEFCDNNIKNASQYGIGKLTVTVEDVNGVHKLSYGNKDEKGNVYTVYNDGNYIFTQNPALYDLMAGVEPRALLDKFAHLIKIDDVREVSIEGQGKKYTLSIQGEGDSATYSINGVSSNEDYFKKAYQAIIGILITEVKTKEVDTTPEYTVIFTMKDGTRDISEYLPYDDRNYLLRRNGNSEYIILKKNLSAALDGVSQYVGSN